MTARRRTRRRRGQVPALPLLAVAAAALGALALVDVLAHVWPVLLAAAVLGAYALGRRPAAPPAGRPAVGRPPPRGCVVTALSVACLLWVPAQVENVRQPNNPERGTDARCLPRHAAPIRP